MILHLSFLLLLLVFLFSIELTYQIDIVQVRISPDSSNSWIVHDGNEGFIVDCGCYWEHGLLVGQTWHRQVSMKRLPSFIFLTHTHPDNLLGLVSLLLELNTTRLPIYVSNSGALNEMNYWLDIWRRVNPFETSILLDRRQSPDQFPYNDHVKVLDRPLIMFNGIEADTVRIISGFPTAESIHASMIYVPSVGALFTGDLVSIRSHLFVSPFDPYPDSDDHVCNWLGILQSLTCTFPSTTRIYSAHGDAPSTMSFDDTIETNMRWLTYMRALVFNSCNVTFVMRILEDVFRNYSNVEQSRASLINQVPRSAMAVGCKCVQDMPSTCGGLLPPPCQFIPKNKTESSKSTALPVGCLRQQLFSTATTEHYSLVLAICLNVILKMF